MQAVGGQLPGQNPFGVIPMTDGLYEIQLSSPAGVNGSVTGPVQVMIAEKIDTWPRSPYNRVVSSAPLVWIVLGVLAGVIAAVCAFLWKRNRLLKRKKGSSTVDT